MHVENLRPSNSAPTPVYRPREEPLLQTLLEAVASPVLLFDVDGAILMANAEARRLFVPSDVDRSTATTVARTNAERLASAVPEDATVPGPSGCLEIRVIDPGNLKELLFEVTRTRIDDPVHGHLVAFALRDRRDHLEQSRFLANISHEFLTPLNAMLGYTSMLLQGVSGPIDESTKKQIRRIETNGVQLHVMINQILDTARLEMGRMPVQMSRFALPGLVNEVTSELEPMIVRSGLSVISDIPEVVPTVWSDREKVKQILLQLLNNALKFTREGGITIHVRPQAARQMVSVAVIDSGVGIAPADHERVFEDFQQVDNSRTHRYGGSGLGLSMCRRYAELLGAQVTLASDINKGSTFTLLLPVRGHR